MIYLGWLSVYLAVVERLGRWLRRPRAQARIELVTGLTLTTDAVRLAFATQ